MQYGDKIAILYDRKSPRHNWLEVCATDNLAHLDAVATHQAQVLATSPGWERGELGIAVMMWSSEMDNLPWSLPKDAPVVARIVAPESASEIVRRLGGL